MDKLDSITIGSMALSTILSALLTLLVCLLGLKILMRLVDKVLAKATKLDGTLVGFIRSAIRILLWILIVIIVAGKLGIPTSSMVAMISVVGLALSLSVQNILSNLFSGLTLLVAQPFHAGDYVEVAGKAGVVKTVGLFYTMISTLDNIAISIPNSDITGSSTEDVKAAIRDAIARDSRILPDPEPFVRLSAYKDSVIDYVVRVWCKSTDYWNVYFDLNENVRDSFAEKGVEMSYNHMNVHMLEK